MNQQSIKDFAIKSNHDVGYRQHMALSERNDVGYESRVGYCQHMALSEHDHVGYESRVGHNFLKTLT